MSQPTHSHRRAAGACIAVFLALGVTSTSSAPVSLATSPAAKTHTVGAIDNTSVAAAAAAAAQVATGGAAPAPAPAPAPSGIVETPLQNRLTLPGFTVPVAARERLTRGGISAEPTGTGPLSGRTIAIDPGHNGSHPAWITDIRVPDGRGRTKTCNTAGTRSTAGLPEHALNWDVSVRLVWMLRANGARVVLTRPSDTGAGPCVNERAFIPNRAQADLLLSIHADGSTSPTARGFHVIRSTAMHGGASVINTSSQLATTVRDAYAAGTGLPRSTYLGQGTGITPRNDIAGLNHLQVPGVMLEMGNMRHAADIAALEQVPFRHRIARALLGGIVEHLTR